MGDPRPLRLSLVQVEPRLGDLRANLEKAAEVVAEEDRAGQDLVIFPELNLCGYFLKDLVPETAVRLDGPELAELAKAAGNSTVVVGCVLESRDHLFFNAAVVLRAHGVAHVHRKLYLPTYGMFDEQRYVGAGSAVESVELDFGQAGSWRLGALICEDLWHPSAPYLLSRQGVDLLVCPSASPGRGVAEPNGELGTAALWGALVRTYSALFTTFVAYCNRVGFEDGHYFWGGSRVHGPTGEALGDPLGDAPGVGRRELDRRWLRRARISYPLLRDERTELLRQGLREPSGGL
ncbi:MAG: carbon-nitrogen hydrolase [Candidatus Dormibacteraeota bacterium]|jgi:predicted amidohydrolase|nr:carbon-nitrogen hydrolase [Candidatus Dormibacteraeota bacterium]